MSELQLWDDNPTTVDLLGFTTIVDTVVAALQSPSLDPVTIGVNAPWGGGKSTVLGLLHEALEREPGFRVIRLDPWEFDDQFDVRGAVIGEVLQDLLTAYPDEQLDAPVNDLLERISWSRVAATMARGQLVAQTDELVKAFTPRARGDAKSLAGFRSEFAKLLQQLEPLKRLVVLVDDLDRCLPDAVMATLEAIKLFLSVKKVAFVLAADQEMVRESIALSLDATGREQFALRYLEKIVQLPLSLPRISTDEAGAYITLLLSQRRCEQEDHFKQLVSHAQHRRAQGHSPVLADMQGLPWEPDAETLGLASRFAAGLAAHRSGSPRSIKRFLNAFALRTRIAERHGIGIDASVIAKLMLLEDSHSKDFETLVRLQEPQRAELLERWQAWGREEGDKPAEVTEDSREWAASDPDLITAPIGPYLSLAASLVSLTAAASLTQQQLTWVGDLCSASEPHRRDAQIEIVAALFTDQQAVVDALVQRAPRESDTDPLADSLVYIALHTTELRSPVADGLWEIRKYLMPGAVVEMDSKGIEELQALIPQLAAATDIDPATREAARIATEGEG
ncbi:MULTISPECIES: KAP family P-loop NTPase fold protein [Streptomyces griseus group]|uniref:KAP family P-loop NTPase fold protein n=1 Tax=Streptomyces griseus group TaxID=629295 RepID=UPI002E11A32D|nr:MULTISPECIES: P-loop NTPase fold protein [Streptomyces griseus group]WSI46082.1 KAP family NTPase [Streptomyces cyaneofuscatus]WSI52665.1 KAP family NTPase [Streptomyces cyaneofuscatus]